jgi:hypothetical protein
MGRPGTFTSETAKKAIAKRWAMERSPGAHARKLARRRERFDKAVWWVATHSLDDKPPSEQERVLQEFSRRNPLAFVKLVIAQVAKAPKEQPMPPSEPEKSFEEEWGLYGQLVKQMLRECEKEGPETPTNPGNPGNTLHVSHAETDVSDVRGHEQDKNGTNGNGNPLTAGSDAAPVLEPIPKPKPQRPRLCALCRMYGYPCCVRCEMVTDPGLQIINGWLRYVRPPTEDQWRRCERCNDCFLAPRYGVPNVCPECREAKAG